MPYLKENNCNIALKYDFNYCVILTDFMKIKITFCSYETKYGALVICSCHEKKDNKRKKQKTKPGKKVVVTPSNI